MGKTNRVLFFENSKCIRHAIVPRPGIRGGWRVYEVRQGTDGREFYGEFLAEFNTKREAKIFKEKMNREVR